ncbi:alpha/beta hydrolase [Solicola gregarius]|uniref:Alpha/beta hydrolase n=1 Tax=Solicola gregarius TaxID=2908642 RepID=A0AA46TL47_9ACTN|nr:alpha/beta hydrolase [Solicola gregarius]UYM06917.1 alpha/beta hydrolase [Solicola gregarius]
MSLSRIVTEVKGAALRGLLALPPPVVRLLAGRPIEREGVELDAEMQLILSLERLEGPPAEERPLPEARMALVTGARMVGGHLPIGSVTDRDIDGPGGRLRLRLYTPRGVTAAGPALVFYHGGGWIYGDLESHDAVCRFLAERAGVRVIAVDYRLAPEAPFPAAVDDALAAYDWLSEHAEGVGVDPSRIAVGGDSAGGNLATVVAQQRAGSAGPAFQLLIYPATDFVTERPSRRAYDEGFYLSRRFMDLAEELYLQDFADRADPRLSPLHGKLDGLAPTYLAAAGFDPLRDEGKAYADALRDAGVEVEYVCERGLIHSFANMVAVGRSAPAAMARAAAALRRGLGG